MTTSTSSGRRGIRLGYRANPVGISALGVILLWVVVALFAPHMIPHSVGEIVDTDYFGPVSRDLWLGSDYLGRDIFSRILMGARYTLGISLAAVSIACFSGVALGMTAAVAGGWLDTMLSRFLDALNSIPSKLFGLVVVAAVGSSIPALIATLSVIYTPGAYRFARALAVNVNTMDFMVVARIRGEKLPYLCCCSPVCPFWDSACNHPTPTGARSCARISVDCPLLRRRCSSPRSPSQVSPSASTF
jgi:peptide/nickel transport system permease protein